jgi:hypothetical protein
MTVKRWGAAGREVWSYDEQLMTSSTAITRSFERSFSLYRDLLAAIDARTLASRLPGLPSNSIGAQLWCVVGARESYARAIAAGTWAGFTCSLDEPGDPVRVAATLEASAASVSKVLESSDHFTETQDRLVLDLLEHEAQHHGQIIRYLYALRLPIPASWKDRYALD